MSIEDLLERKKRELIGLYNPKDEELYEDVYKDIQNKKLAEIFAKLHASFDELFKFMNHKNESNKHFNAVESRELLSLISFFERIKVQLLESIS